MSTTFIVERTLTQGVFAEIEHHVDNSKAPQMPRMHSEANYRDASLNDQTQFECTRVRGNCIQVRADCEQCPKLLRLQSELRPGLHLL